MFAAKATIVRTPALQEREAPICLPTDFATKFCGIKHLPVQAFVPVKKFNDAGRLQGRIIIIAGGVVFLCTPEGEVRRSFPLEWIHEVFCDTHHGLVVMIVPQLYDLAVFVTSSTHPQSSDQTLEADTAATAASTAANNSSFATADVLNDTTTSSSSKRTPSAVASPGRSSPRSSSLFGCLAPWNKPKRRSHSRAGSLAPQTTVDDLLPGVTSPAREDRFTIASRMPSFETASNGGMSSEHASAGFPALAVALRDAYNTLPDVREPLRLTTLLDYAEGSAPSFTLKKPIGVVLPTIVVCTEQPRLHKKRSGFARRSIFSNASFSSAINTEDQSNDERAPHALDQSGRRQSTLSDGGRSERGLGEFADFPDAQMASQPAFPAVTPQPSASGSSGVATTATFGGSTSSTSPAGGLRGVGPLFHAGDSIADVPHLHLPPSPASRPESRVLENQVQLSTLIEKVARLESIIANGALPLGDESAQRTRQQQQPQPAVAEDGDRSSAMVSVSWVSASAETIISPNAAWAEPTPSRIPNGVDDKRHTRTPPHRSSSSSPTRSIFLPPQPRPFTERAPTVQPEVVAFVECGPTPPDAAQSEGGQELSWYRSRCEILSEENALLRARVAALEEEAAWLRNRFLQHPSTSGGPSPNRRWR